MSDADNSAVKNEEVQWECEVTSLQEGKSWTVGDKHNLACRGDYIEKLEAPLKIKVIPPEKKQPEEAAGVKTAPPMEDPNIDYALVILEAKQVDNSSADFVVTSYKPGQYKDVKIKIVDQKNAELNVQAMNWEVTSVITKETQNGFGPTSPLKLAYPWWLWLVMAGAIAFVALLIIGKVLLLNRYRKLMKEVKSHATALGPINQFYKDLRSLKSLYLNNEDKTVNTKEYWEALEYKFELYLIRQFEIPANKWSDQKVMAEIKKNLGSQSSLKLNNQLKRILSEFKKGNKAENIQVEDIQQMEVISQNYVENIKKITERRPV